MSRDSQTLQEPRTLFVCVRAGEKKCAGRGSLTLLRDMRAALAEENVGPDELAIRPSGCLGLCKQGPAMLAARGETAGLKKPPKPKKENRNVRTRVKPDEIREVLREALLGPF